MAPLLEEDEEETCTVEELAEEVILFAGELAIVLVLAAGKPEEALVDTDLSLAETEEDEDCAAALAPASLGTFLEIPEAVVLALGP